MIKGCEKRVVWLRNTESDVFDQAYFILSESAYTKRQAECDIVAEAKRIIANAPFTVYDGAERFKEKKRRPHSAFSKALFFALGVFTGAMPLALFSLLF